MREAKPALLLREDLAEIWTQLALGWETVPFKSGPFGKGWCSGPVELPLARSSLKVSAYVVADTSGECEAFLVGLKALLEQESEAILRSENN